MTEPFPLGITGVWEALKSSVLQPSLWLELARQYRRRGLPWQAGYAARQAFRCDAELRPQLDALDLGPWQDGAAGDGLLGRAGLADAAELAGRFAEVVVEQPGDWLTWLYLARLHDMPGPQQHGDNCRQALLTAERLEPIAGESRHWLGLWRLNAGNPEAAVDALAALVDLRPLRHGSMMYLGEALLRLDNVAAAEKAFSRASISDNPDFLLTLATRVYAHNYWREAIAVLRKAVGLRPQHMPSWLALARVQSEVYRLADCRDSLRHALELEPANREAALIDAGLQGRIGDARSHLAQLQAAYEAEGDPLSRLASSIAMTALYHDEMEPEEVARLHRRLCVPIESAITATPRSAFGNPREGGRRLRIGYVSGDLHRQHPVNLFMLPVLMHHDRAKFEICIYYTGSMHDEYTRRAEDCTDRWLDAANLDDAALRQAITDDGIDVLVDLAGHTSTHRLGVFAQRAAPVQATFLGYPHSSGLAAMDWILGDPIVTPADHAHLFSEGLAQLPGSVFCWAPVDEYPLPPARRPEAPLVFGSFNNAIKLSPRILALWARILRALPEAKLLLKAPSLGNAEVRDRFVRRFAELGVPPGRLEFRGPSGLAEMMQEYGDIDIALDPFPYNGGTTTLQVLWMGVPVVTLAGGNFAGRMGASFLHAVGHPEWVADDEDEYLAVAIELAGDVVAWRERRAALRAQMIRSALCAIEPYTIALEALYERMWAAHCGNEAIRFIGPHSPERTRSFVADCSTTPGSPATFGV